jgi:hypothetical protein
LTILALLRESPPWNDGVAAVGSHNSNRVAAPIILVLT